MTGEILQDEWSDTSPLFGETGQLKVIGWSGRLHTTKYYLLTCSVCSDDFELFGDGIFRSTKAQLMKGQVPCGCSRIPKWTKEQWKVIARRKAAELNFNFIDYTGNWLGNNTKVVLNCPEHGTWQTSTLATLVRHECGCPTCASMAISRSRIKSDDVMIASFFASGAFYPDTRFWRSDRVNSGGYKPYWFMDCPECGEVGEAASPALQRGARSCACSTHRQNKAYINLIYDNDNIVAIKFGVTRNVLKRVREHNKKSVYRVVNYAVYNFPDVISCKTAERLCRERLAHKVLTKQEMPDGYTETTYAYNIEEVMKIYQDSGGVLHAD